MGFGLVRHVVTLKTAFRTLALAFWIWEAMPVAFLSGGAGPAWLMSWAQVHPRYRDKPVWAVLFLKAAYKYHYCHSKEQKETQTGRCACGIMVNRTQSI